MDLLPNISGPAAIFWGVLTFSILVIIHEGGHFLSARAFGVKVHEFMVGLPGPALRWKSPRSGVTYGVTAIPLGGYVRIAGMEPGDEDSLLAEALAAVVRAGEIDDSALATEIRVSKARASEMLATLLDYGAVEAVEDSRSYRALAQAEPDVDPDEALRRVRSQTYRGLPTYKRIIVLCMGVLFNLATAVLIFTFTLSIWGYPVPSLAIAGVAKDSGAATAGMRAGDRIIAVEGTKLAEWEDLTKVVTKMSPGKSVRVTFIREGDTQVVSVKLGRHETGRPLLGVTAGTENRTMAPLEAFTESISWIGLVFVAIVKFFDPRTFSQAVEGARSVVGISYEVADAARRGPIDYAWMVALLSLSLGVMNILPIPPLDGGKVVLEIIEKLRRRPLRREVSLAVSAVGAVLLFSLIFYLMYADIMRYIVKG